MQLWGVTLALVTAVCDTAPVSAGAAGAAGAAQAPEVPSQGLS